MTRLKKTVLGAGIITATGIAAWLWFRDASPRAGRLEPIEVKKGSIRQAVLATGVAQPQNRLEIKPPIAGRAETILVKEGEEVKRGQILATLSSTERAAVLDAARAKGRDELTRWREIYRATPLVAPISGLIIARRVEPGQTVTIQDAVLVMSDRLIVKAQVDETDIGQIRVGQRAEIVLDAYPSQRLVARVDLVAYEAKTTNNVTTYDVEVVPERIPDHMKSGMTANVEFEVVRKDDVLVLPAAAVRQEEGSASVMVGNPPERREVTTGITDGKTIEIVSGLREGETVLMSVPGGQGREERRGSPFSPFRSKRGNGGGAGKRGGSHP